MTAGQNLIKRIMDLLLSMPLLVLSFPVLLVLIFLASIDTKQFGLFSQVRVGRNASYFKLFKIRTLKGNAHRDMHEINQAASAFGKWLRRTKLDELPQLFQVVGGQMSVVGPRPDIPGYADQLQGEDRIILKLRPGITGPASIKYRNEDQLLLQQQDPNKFNDEIGDKRDDKGERTNLMTSWSGYWFASLGLIGQSCDATWLNVRVCRAEVHGCGSNAWAVMLGNC